MLNGGGCGAERTGGVGGGPNKKTVAHVNIHGFAPRASLTRFPFWLVLLCSMSLPFALTVSDNRDTCDTRRGCAPVHLMGKKYPKLATYFSASASSYLKIQMVQIYQAPSVSLSLISCSGGDAAEAVALCQCCSGAPVRGGK